jgi:hypothetical protein
MTLGRERTAPLLYQPIRALPPEEVFCKVQQMDTSAVRRKNYFKVFQKQDYLAACPYRCPCRMSMFHVNVYVHASYPCCIYMSMLHFHASMLHVHAVLYAACPCCITVLLAHTACPCCVSMSMLHFHVCAACPCQCRIYMPMLHVHVHAACPFFMCMLLLC